jgi:hypothetical protein
MEPKGKLRLLSPLLALQFPRRTDRTTRQMIELIEGRSSISASSLEGV